MNSRHLRENRKLRDKLAAEYVLGTLRFGARRRFEKWISEDALLREAVTEWQDRLIPMAEFTAPVTPARHVWQSIEKRLHIGSENVGTSHQSSWSRLRDSIGFWRRLGVASTALATILAAMLIGRQPEPVLPNVSYVATLSDEKAQPVMIVTGDAGRRQLTVKVLASQAIPADKSLELWALPREGAPRSLGLVAPGATVVLPMPADATPQTIAALAISLEPKEGSPTPNAPSGPVLFKGTWVKI